MGFRSARIPYPAKEERVDDIIPLLFFDNKYVFLRGLTGGIKLYNKNEWQFSLIGLQGKYCYSPHHRSSIFETSSAFGQISGSNCNTLYLQYHF